MSRTKQLSRAVGRCYHTTLLAAAAFACCCSYAVAQDSMSDTAPDPIASADTVMMLAENAASCAANPAACAVHVYAGRGAEGSGAGSTTGGGSPGGGSGGPAVEAGTQGGAGLNSAAAALEKIIDGKPDLSDVTAEDAPKQYEPAISEYFKRLSRAE